jgi:hypothetical protein
MAISVALQTGCSAVEASMRERNLLFSPSAARHCNPTDVSTPSATCYFPRRPRVTATPRMCPRRALFFKVPHKTVCFIDIVGKNHGKL